MSTFSKKNFFALHRKFISSFLIVVIVSSGIFISQPSTAHAQWLVADPILDAVSSIDAGAQVNTSINESLITLKEYVGDSLLWFIGKVILQKMTQSLVSWINSGFHGAPTFVSNPQAYFSTIGDQIAGNLILNDPNLNFLCSNFGPQLRITLNNQLRGGANSNYNVKCTLNSVVSNIDAFNRDFSQGGWLAFNSSMQQNNNPYGAYFSITDQVTRSQQTALSQSLNKLNWGKGFLSIEKCGPDTIVDLPQQENTDGPITTVTGGGVESTGNCSIQTPGDVLSSQINNQLNVPANTLVTADEINEIIGALLTTLTNKVFSAAAGGLRGLGNGSSLDDGGAQIRSLQNIQVPPTGSYTAGAAGQPGTVTQLDPNAVISGFIGSDQTGTGGTGGTTGTTTTTGGTGGGTTTIGGGAGGTIALCPGFNCTFTLGVMDAAGTACLPTSITGEVCTGGVCPDPGTPLPPGSTQGTWQPLQASADIQCGGCLVSQASCDVAGLYQNCIMKFATTTNPSCVAP